MSQPQSAGISTLLEAEKEAAKVVAQARQYRITKLKEAKDDAAKEIEALKAKKEKEFQDHSASLSKGDDNAKMVAEIEAKLQSVRQLAAKNKDDVISVLLEKVLSVDPKVHVNAVV